MFVIEFNEKYIFVEVVQLAGENCPNWAVKIVFEKNNLYVEGVSHTQFQPSVIYRVVQLIFNYKQRLNK